MLIQNVVVDVTRFCWHACYVVVKYIQIIVKGRSTLEKYITSEQLEKYDAQFLDMENKFDKILRLIGGKTDGKQQNWTFRWWK